MFLACIIMAVSTRRFMKLSIVMVMSFLLRLIEVRHDPLKLLNPIDLLLNSLFLCRNLPGLPEWFHCLDLLIPIFLLLVESLCSQLILILKVWIHTVFYPLDMAGLFTLKQSLSEHRLTFWHEFENSASAFLHGVAVRMRCLDVTLNLVDELCHSRVLGFVVDISSREA